MLPRNVRLGLVATAAAGLVAGGLATTAAAAPHAHRVATPHITAVFHKGGKLDIKGPKTVPAGAVNFTARSTSGDWELGVFSFKKHYSLKQFKADIRAFGASMAQNNGRPTKAGLRHLRHAVHHVYAYGGFEANPKLTETGALQFTHPGTVYLWNDESGMPVSIHKIKVTKSAVMTPLPATTAHVAAQQNRRFGGSKILPAKGSITFTNKSTESPHFLVLQHVKNGVTRKQIVKYFQSGSNQPPSWGLQGEESTNTITYGQSQTLSLNLPKGEYAELCFFPDPQTGEPHVMMGMVGVVHLR